MKKFSVVLLLLAASSPSAQSIFIDLELTAFYTPGPPLRVGDRFSTRIRVKNKSTQFTTVGYIFFERPIPANVPAAGVIGTNLQQDFSLQCGTCPLIANVPCIETAVIPPGQTAECRLELVALAPSPTGWRDRFKVLNPMFIVDPFIDDNTAQVDYHIVADLVTQVPISPWAYGFMVLMTIGIGASMARRYG